MLKIQHLYGENLRINQHVQRQGQPLRRQLRLRVGGEKAAAAFSSGRQAVLLFPGFLSEPDGFFRPGVQQNDAAVSSRQPGKGRARRPAADDRDVGFLLRPGGGETIAGFGCPCRFACSVRLIRHTDPS